MEAVIADTSVWIDFFNGIENKQVEELIACIEKDYAVYLCPVIIQEILQGIANEKDYKKVRENLFAFAILNDDSLEAASGAVKIYRSLRKKGIGIRKSNDCIIAHYAFKYNLRIQHRDRDFDMIAENYR